MEMSSTYVSVIQIQDYSPMLIINETFFNTSSEELSDRINETLEIMDENLPSPIIKDTRMVDYIPAIVADNSHIVIPLMSFVFGFPVLVMTILCIIQERNKWIYERQATVRMQQARLSTTSSMYTGLNSTRSTLHLKDSINPVVYVNNEQNLRNGYHQKTSEEATTIIDNGYDQKIHRMKEFYTKMSDETLEEIDELEMDNSKMFNSLSNDKSSFVMEV